tara:strand:- start:252 stop:866 length:615 start_codon:yes stop_codon:yes gene_type:complete
MSKNFETIGLFPVPVIKIKFKDHYKYDFLEVKKKDKKPDTWTRSVNTTFPIIEDDDSIVPSILRESLKKDLHDSIVETFEQLNLPTNINFMSFWYNIYHDNQGQERHDHLSGAGEELLFWSGIYYNKNATPTTFYREDKTYKTQLFGGSENTALAQCLTSSFSPFVKDGDVILFPPYLEHSVESKPQHKDGMRMTFSFNITLNS